MSIPERLLSPDVYLNITSPGTAEAGQLTPEKGGGEASGGYTIKDGGGKEVGVLSADRLTLETPEGTYNFKTPQSDEQISAVLKQQQAPAAAAPATRMPAKPPGGGTGEMIQHFLDIALPAAGGTVGGVVGAVPGAALGAAAGAGAAQLTRPLLAPKETKDLIGEFVDLAINAGLGGLGEAAAPFVQAGARAVAAPVISAAKRVAGPIIEGVKTAAAGVGAAAGASTGLAKRFLTGIMPDSPATSVRATRAAAADAALRSEGSSLSLGQLAGPGTAMATMDRTIGASFSGGAKMQAFAEARTAAVNRLTEGLRQAITDPNIPTREAVSRLISVVGKSDAAFVIEKNALYGPLDAMTANVKVTPDVFDQFIGAVGYREDVKRLAGYVGRLTRTKDVSEETKLLLSRLDETGVSRTAAGAKWRAELEAAQTIPYAHAAEARSILLAAGRNAGATGDVATRNVANHLADLLGRDIANAPGVTPAITNAANDAAKYYAANVGLTRGHVIQEVLGSLTDKPDILAKTVLASPITADAIRAATAKADSTFYERTIAPKIALAIMDAGMSVAQKESLGAVAETSGPLLRSALKRLVQSSGGDRAVAKSILAPGAYDKLMGLSRTIDIAADQPRGFALFSVGQYLAIGTLLHGGIGFAAGVAGSAVGGGGGWGTHLSMGAAGSAMFILMGPKTFAHVMSDPAMIQAVTNAVGASARATTPAASRGITARLLTQLTAFAAKQAVEPPMLSHGVDLPKAAAQ